MSIDDRGLTAYVVIPAYNESTVIGEVVASVRTRYPDVVVVDDGSTDDTGVRARAAGARVLTHLVNRGNGAALKTGIDWAVAHQADVVVTFDGDGQHHAEDVDALIAPIVGGQCDVVLGSRFRSADARVPLARRWTLKCGVLFTRVTAGIAVTDTHNGLRAFSRHAASRIRISHDRMAHASEILNEIGRLGLRFCEIPVRVTYSAYSQTKGQRSTNALRIVWDLLVG
jgi:glycosyltransferase involved in cell wall biosynthesis